MTPDFLTRLEHQLVEAAERDLRSLPRERRARAWSPRAGSRRALTALPAAAALACVALIAGLVLVLGGEERSSPAPTPAGAVPGVAPSLAGRARSLALRGRTRVFVLNGTTRNGLAAEAARRLEATGYRVVGTAAATASDVAHTELFARRSTDLAGVAAQLGGARTHTTTTGPDRLPTNIARQVPRANLVVLLGADFRLPEHAVPPPVAPASVRPFLRQQVTLRATDAGGRAARGIVVLTDGGLTFQAHGLARTKGGYLIWLRNTPQDALPLGFAVVDGTTGFLSGTLSRLPAGAGRFGSIVVTRQAGGRTTPPGPVVLAGKLERQAVLRPGARGGRSKASP